MIKNNLVAKNFLFRCGITSVNSKTIEPTIYQQKESILKKINKNKLVVINSNDYKVERNFGKQLLELLKENILEYSPEDQDYKGSIFIFEYGSKSSFALSQEDIRNIFIKFFRNKMNKNLSEEKLNLEEKKNIILSSYFIVGSKTLYENILTQKQQNLFFHQTNIWALCTIAFKGIFKNNTSIDDLNEIFDIKKTDVYSQDILQSNIKLIGEKLNTYNENGVNEILSKVQQCFNSNISQTKTKQEVKSTKPIVAIGALGSIASIAAIYESQYKNDPEENYNKQKNDNTMDDDKNNTNHSEDYPHDPEHNFDNFNKTDDDNEETPLNV